MRDVSYGGQMSLSPGQIVWSGGEDHLKSTVEKKIARTSHF